MPATLSADDRAKLIRTLQAVPAFGSVSVGSLVNLYGPLLFEIIGDKVDEPVTLEQYLTCRVKFLWRLGRSGYCGYGDHFLNHIVITDVINSTLSQLQEAKSRLSPQSRTAIEAADLGKNVALPKGADTSFRRLVVEVPHAFFVGNWQV